MTHIRKDFHIAVNYQFRLAEKNLATLEEERILSINHGIHSCKYENWETACMAMTYNARIKDENAIIQAALHLIRMIIRKHKGRNNIKIIDISLDAELKDNFYKNHILPLLDN